MGDVDSGLTAISAAAAGPVAADAERVDRERVFPEGGMRALGEAGGLGLLVAAEHGGLGGGLGALAQACEAVGESCASTGMVFLMHSVSAATVGAAGGGRAEELLRGMADGTVIGTLAFSERGTGAHFYAPELKATRSNGSVTVSGRKSFVTSGGHADAYVLLLQGEAEGTADVYVVAKDEQGVRFDGTWSGLGMAGNSSVGLELENVELPNEARLGAPGGGGDLVFGVVAPFFLVGLAAVNVGIAAAAAKAATAHAAGRLYPDGTSLAEVQYVQHLLADMDIAVRTARLLVAEAARLGDAGDEGALVPIMEAEVAATEAAATVTSLALLATGGQGYTPALTVERHLRDARAGAVMAPTNAVLRTWIGKALAGLPVP